MSKNEKIRERILLGNSDANIDFADMRHLLVSLGFEERVKGSHFIYSRPGIEEIINIQTRGGKAKAYQVKQVRNIILRYRLREKDE